MRLRTLLQHSEGCRCQECIAACIAFFRYRLPALEIDPVEKDIWQAGFEPPCLREAVSCVPQQDLTQDGADVQAGFDKLNAARLELRLVTPMVRAVLVRIDR